MKQNQYHTTERAGRKGLAWAFVIGFIILLVLAGFFIAYQLKEQKTVQEAELEQLEEKLQDARTEKVLLEQQLMQKETEIKNLVTGVVSEEGVQDYRAYLTFDDGPCQNTLKVMDILDEYGIKGTFFMNGQESELAKEVYARTVEDGHVLANHTYSHAYRTIYESWESFYQELQKMEECVKEQTGYEVEKIVRFPGGSNNGTETKMRDFKKRLDELGYRYFDWNVSGEDAIYSDVPGSEVYKNVIKYVDGKNIAVILLHTTNKTEGTVQVLPDIIDYLLKEGYSFHTLDEEDAPAYVVFDQDYK